MKSGIMHWVSHSNMPILSVDVQPNGFRFVTGGSDHKVCIWNLLPAISLKYENPPKLTPPRNQVGNQGNGDLSVIVEETKHQEKGSVHKKKYNSAASDFIIKCHIQEADQIMRSDNNSNDDISSEDDGTVDSTTKWRDCEEALKVEDEEGFEDDVKLMEDLFVDFPQKRYQRLLAVIVSHEAPVNCVRWNFVGTLFASAADDGTVILQEYMGELAASGLSQFQKYQFNTDAGAGDGGGFGMPPSASSLEESKVTEKKEEDENLSYEKWRCKRSWKVHKGGVSDLAWSPDNIHLGTCGTDSTVIIWNINETSPIRIIDAKANGITFDPFGKFMATQSSEERSLTIWRIQQNFKNITQECMHHSYYKQSQSMSMFRRLSWSSDGQFISTTAGRCGGIQTAPLISRSTWKLAATLSGHNKTITSSRINPRLYRDNNSDSDGGLACYSIVAIASIDSTISVWKPGMSHPLTVMMDVFHMGISDLSWGFNGNILLASSHDGKIVMLHYQPGRLGQPLSELEKQLIIEKRYGTSVLNEYKSHTKLQQAQQQAQQVSSNGSQQQQKNVLKNGKMKIVPITTMQYQVSENINPYQNPFTNQMLKDDSAHNFQGGSLKPSMMTSSLQSSNFPEMNFNISKPVITTAAQIIPQQNTQTEQLAKPETFPNSRVVVQPIQQNTLISLVDPISISAGLSDLKQVSGENEEQKESSNALENSGKKTKKNKKPKKDEPMPLNNQVAPQGQPNQVQSAQLPSINLSQTHLAQLPGKQEIKSSLISQTTLQNLQKEQYCALERLLIDSNQNQVTVMCLEDYQAHTSILGKEEIQLILPSRDIFSDEIRVLISNQDLQQAGGNVFSRKSSADLRFYSGSENFLIDRKLLDGEFIIQTSISSNFFIIYTSQGKLSVFSTRSIQPIKQGLVLEGACFIETNDDAMCFVVLTLKGSLFMYRVKNIGDQGLIGMQAMADACVLEWQVNSLVDILKQRNAAIINSLDSNGVAEISQTSQQTQRVSVRYLKLLNDTSVLVFLSDDTLYEFDPKIRVWRQCPMSGAQAVSMQEQLRSSSSINNLSLVNQQQSQSQLPMLKDLSAIISQLEKQTMQDQVQPADADVDMSSLTSRQVETHTRLSELQESLQLYDRLQMKNEFVYTLRMYTLALLQAADMNRLRDMLIEYKLVMSWEDERQMEIGSKGHQKAIVVNKDSAYNHIMHLIAQSEQDQISGDAGGNQITAKTIEKPFQLICGTVEKSTIFQQAILPVFKTVSAQLNCDIKDYVGQIVNSIFNPSNSIQNQQQQQQRQQQHQLTLPSFQTVTEAAALHHQQQQQIVHQHHHQMDQSASFGVPHMTHIHAPQGPPTQLPSITNVLNAAMMASSSFTSGPSSNSMNGGEVGVPPANPQGTQYHNI